MTPPESQSVALELERLRGTTESGFARIDGRLDVVLERTNRAAEDVQQLREDHDQDIAELRAELEEFKRGRWPLPSIGVLTGLLGVVVAVIALYW